MSRGVDQGYGRGGTPIFSKTRDFVICHVCVDVFVCDAFQVDPGAFAALIECISEGDFDTCEQVPAGDDDGFLVNPLGGLATDMAGPARYQCCVR